MTQEQATQAAREEPEEGSPKEGASLRSAFAAEEGGLFRRWMDLERPRSGIASKADGSGYVSIGADGSVTYYDGNMVPLSTAPPTRWGQTEQVLPEEEPKPDAVVMPPHYTRFEIEPIRFVVENFGPSFLVGNIIKYIMRYDAKNGVEDLLKAERYTRMLRAFVQKDPDWWKADKTPAQDGGNG